MKGTMKFNPADRKAALWTELGGRIGRMAERGLDRLHAPEFHEQFLIADLDFNQERWFTNYSGDISGRFLECMTLAGGGDLSCHPALPFMLEQIPANQQADGHFGIPVDFGQPIDYEQEVPRMMPILWGNARMLPALVEAWLAFQDAKLLCCAERLGDFYLTVEKDLASPERVEKYRATGTYAPGYATCYFPAIEGLVRLWEVTGEKKYLELAERMADFRKEYGFDRLPIEHSHGYLCSLYGLLLLHCAEGGEKWLRMAGENWNDLMDGGYVLPTGGLLERAVHGFDLDEGCSQADWLRVNLLFFAVTGEDRYMDMAERVLHNQLRMNQCSTGGFGHRKVLYDAHGAAGYGTYLWEALWCCDFHVATALLGLKRYVLLRGEAPDAVRIPLFMDFQAEDEYALVSMKEVEGNAQRRRWKLLLFPKKEQTMIWLRIPDWAGELSVRDGSGREVPAVKEGRWLGLPAAPGCSGTVGPTEAAEGNRKNGIESVEYICEIDCPMWVEDRHFGRTLSDREEGSFLLRQGPDLLVQTSSEGVPEVIGTPEDDREAVYVFRIAGEG